MFVLLPFHCVNTFDINKKDSKNPSSFNSKLTAENLKMI